MGQFYYAAKAFDVLERLDPNPEYWEGKRGACVGIFQMIIAGHEPRYTLIMIIFTNCCFFKRFFLFLFYFLIFVKDIVCVKVSGVARFI